jgi:iron complex outermembrane recepter protein
MQSKLRLNPGSRMAWWRPRAVAWIFLSACCAAAAADPPPAVRFLIHQPAQPLADALTAISRQTGRSLLFNPVLIDGRMARAISGQMSAEEAVLQLLQGTGLIVQERSGALVVVRPAPALAPAAAPAAPSSLSTPAAAERHARVSRPVERLAQASPATTSDAGSGALALGGTASRVQTMEITGTRLKRVDAETSLPVNVYTRADIEKSGQTSLGQFLAGLNEVSMGQGEGAFSGTAQGQGTVQLRGLPLGSTLVLVNGRRMQAVGASSANFFSLNLIPLAAVERVEVVPVGSSAVYGGDALAGVVNIILRKTIEGVTLSARAASGKGFDDGGISVGTGDSGEQGGWMVLGSFSKATPLAMDERAFFRDADYRRFGGVDGRERNCVPGTVTSATGAKLPGLDATFAAIPATGQPLTIQSFVPTAGQANLCSNFSNASASSLMHATQSLGVHASGYRLLSGTLTGFGELTAVRDETRAEGLGLNLNNVLVPATNLHNPFGEPVRVTARLGPENGHEAYSRDTNFLRALVGLRGEFGAGWDFEGTASMSRDQGRRLLWRNTVDVAARTAALASTDPATSLNPFTAGRAASDEVLSGIWSNNLRSTFGRKTIASGFVRGPLLELPAGAVETIIGGEAAWDDFRNLQPGANTVASRRSSALYGELRAPLWQGGEGMQRRWTLAALTLAARRDRYSDAGSADTYQAGLELRPARTLLLRASAATSFKPPNLFQSNVEEALIPLTALRIVDPARGDAPVTSGDGMRMSNTQLRPETGKAFALGAVWEPDAASGTRLALTGWDVRIVDLIGFLPPQVVVNNEALFPGFVTRGPAVGGVPGPITQLLLAETNFGFVQTQGVDVEAARSWQGPVGRWSLGASATRVTKYDVSIAPGVPVTPRLGRRFGDNWAPQWKVRLTAGLDGGSWSVGIISRYLSTYKDVEPSDRTLGGTWTHDLSARLDLVRLGLHPSHARAASLSLGVVNVCNQLPKYASITPYFDTSQGDWRGRYVSLRLSVDW